MSNKQYKCTSCGANELSICCTTGKNRYIFDWAGGGFNQTKADSPEQAYEKVVAQRQASNSNLRPLKHSFRLYTQKEYDRLSSGWD